jgi:rhodanese-related sulfurtransferase
MLTTIMATYQGRQIDLLIDVRSRIEYFLGHLDGAVCIPHDQLPGALERREGITPRSRIVLYCASGSRSAAAAAALRDAGYTQVSNIGGIAEARTVVAAG